MLRCKSTLKLKWTYFALPTPWSIGASGGAWLPRGGSHDPTTIRLILAIIGNCDRGVVLLLHLDGVAGVVTLLSAPSRHARGRRHVGLAL